MKPSFFQRAKFATQVIMGKLDSESQGVLAGLISSMQTTFPMRNTASLLNTYNESPWIRACASKVADSISAVRWRLYTMRSNRTGKILPAREFTYLKSISNPEARLKAFHNVSSNENIEEVTNHLFLDMFNNANSEMTGLEFRWILSVWLDLVGDAFFLKEKNVTGATVSLWPIPPHWVVQTPTAKKPSYRVVNRAWQQEIPQEEVLWLRNMNPVNPYGRGSGVTRALSDEITIDEFAAKHSLAFFRNMGRPDLLVMPKTDNGQIGETEIKRLEQMWSDKLQGYWRRFKPMFLQRPMDVTLIQQNFKDMQLIELRKSEADTILQTWGVSPEIFGRLESSNKATVEKAIDIFARFVLVPRLERIREALQERLLPEYDDRLILSYDSPIPLDREFSLNVYKGQPGAFELNEWRALAGLQELDDLEGQFGRAGNTQNNKPEDLDQEPKLENLDNDEIKQFHYLLSKVNQPQRIIK